MRFGEFSSLSGFCRPSLGRYFFLPPETGCWFGEAIPVKIHAAFHRHFPVVVASSAMAADFDPYYKWLGISPDERLPTHYRLLGLIAFESDPEVIEAAADRVMSYLQEVSTGAEMARAQKLLGEVSRARLCLLNAEKKEAYDEKLRARLAAIEADKTLRSDAASSEAAPEPQGEDPLSPIESERFDKPPPQKFPADSVTIPGVPQERSLQEVEDPNVRSRRVLFVAGCAVILLLLFVGGFLFRMISGDAVVEEPEVPPKVASREGGTDPFQRNPKETRGAVIPPDPTNPSPTAKNVERTAPEENQEPTESDGKKSKEPEPAKTDEAEESDEDEADTAPEEEEPPAKQSIGFVELQIAPTDTKTKYRYQKQPNHFYTADGSTSAYYRLEVSATSGGPLAGLCLEMHAPSHQTATLTNMELGSVSWLGAIDSLGQGGAATVIDANENAGWQLQFSGGEPVWAVFAAKRPFDPNFLIEMKHSSNTQRLPSFRLWGITGSGTAEEMAQAVRDRVPTEKPFVDFVARGLPAGRTGEVGLGSLFLGKEKLVAHLFGGNSNPDGVRFSLEQMTSEEEEDVQRWQFILSGAEQTPVAELTLKENKLFLGWLPAAGELPESASLQNGLLQLHIGKHVRSVPLREVKEQAPLTYNPLKAVKPQIEVPAGVPAADLRLVLQFPEQTFGVNKRLVLSLAGDEKEQEVSLRDPTIMKLVASFKAPMIILRMKTLLRTGIEDKKGKKRTKDEPLRKAFAEIPELNARTKKGEKIIETIEAAEEHAHRKRPTTAQKQEMAKITRQWRALGLPRGDISTEQMEKLRGVFEAKQEKIKNRRDRLQLLQGWAEQTGDAEAIEFRLYTLVDGVPLDLVRSTGWVGD